MFEDENVNADKQNDEQRQNKLIVNEVALKPVKFGFCLFVLLKQVHTVPPELANLSISQMIIFP